MSRTTMLFFVLYSLAGAGFASQYDYQPWTLVPICIGAVACGLWRAEEDMRG